jgi:hypothetical protein
MVLSSVHLESLAARERIEKSTNPVWNEAAARTMREYR